MFAGIVELRLLGRVVGVWHVTLIEGAAIAASCVALAFSNVNTWDEEPFCSGGTADIGGVAVIALGKNTGLETADEIGCPEMGVSR
jgi:hypothetical protein